MNAWEAVPFEAFTRQSRVTINVQKDLEDMLNKLDRPQGKGVVRSHGNELETSRQQCYKLTDRLPAI